MSTDVLADPPDVLADPPDVLADPPEVTESVGVDVEVYMDLRCAYIMQM